jgi:hypothetical protein
MGNHVKIVQTPSGGAPDWVREAWVGMILPLQPQKVMSDQTVRNVVSLVEVKNNGFSVSAMQAIDTLADRNPKAANWWKTNTRCYSKGTVFVFNKECGDIVD